MLKEFPRVTSVLIAHDSKTRDYEYTLFTLQDGRRIPMVTVYFPESEVNQKNLAPTAYPEEWEYLGGFDGETFDYSDFADHIDYELNRILNKGR